MKDLSPHPQVHNSNFSNSTEHRLAPGLGRSRLLLLQPQSHLFLKQLITHHRQILERKPAFASGLSRPPNFRLIISIKDTSVEILRSHLCAQQREFWRRASTGRNAPVRSFARCGRARQTSNLHVMCATRAHTRSLDGWVSLGGGFSGM